MVPPNTRSVQGSDSSTDAFIEAHASAKANYRLEDELE